MGIICPACAEVSGADTILEMTSKKLGLTTVVDAKGIAVRHRHRWRLAALHSSWRRLQPVTAGDLASRHPKTIGPDELRHCRRNGWSVSPSRHWWSSAAESPGRVIHLHDLLKHGIV